MSEADYEYLEELCREVPPAPDPEKAALKAEVAECKKALVAIRDYEPKEVCKDDWAYDRMVEAYREAARAALRHERGSTGMTEEEVLSCVRAACGRGGRGMNDEVRIHYEVEELVTVIKRRDWSEAVLLLAAARRKWRNEGIKALQERLFGTAATDLYVEWVDAHAACLLEKE